MKFTLLLLITLLIRIESSSSQLAPSISSIQNITDLKTKINKIVVSTNQNSINIYIASINHLYKLTDQLNANSIYNDYEQTGNELTTRSVLRIETDLITGPKQQKPQCAFILSTTSQSSCIKYICDDDAATSVANTQSKQSTQLIDNENRLLLIDSKRDQLIECGTIDYGGCRLRRLSDLSVLGCNYSAPVIPFSSAGGVVTNDDDDNLLFLMVSMENDPTERLDKSDFPVFSIRNLIPPPEQQHQQQQQQQSSKSQLFQLKYPIEYMNYDQSLFDSDFHMKIIYSFKHDGFVYFLFTITNRKLTQSCNSIFTSPANDQTSSTIVTRMLRICDTTWSATNNQQQQQKSAFNRNNRDSNQESIEQILGGSATNLATLSEIIIDCDDDITGTKYHVLQSAHLHSTSNPDDSTLFMTFNSTTTTTTKSSQSGVCSVRMKQIDQHFSTMLNKCLDGNNSYAELVSPYSNKNTWKAPCRCSMISDYFKKAATSDILNNERKLFCHNDYFNYMNGRQPLTLNAIRFDINNQIKAITSIVTVATTNTNSPNKIVIIISTIDGFVFMNTYDQQTNRAFKYDQINIPMALPNSAVLVKQAAISINLVIVDENANRLLYITYDRYLIKVNLQNCEQFQTCDSCMNHNNNSQIEANNLNPFCGWCVYEQKCMPEQMCIKQTILKQQILSSSDNYMTESLWLKANKATCPAITEISPSKYLNPMLISSSMETINLGLNLKLLPNVKYFCDVNTNFNEFSLANSIHYTTSLNRVDATFLNESHLQCDLRIIKTKFQKIIKQMPIQRKLANLTLQIRAAASSMSDSTTTLLSKTKLFAFNCSYFKQCSQCLNKELNGGCVWCGSNSKCVFAQDSNSMCSNESEFYSLGSNEMCTSFSLFKNKVKKRIEIAYSADSSLSQHSDMLIHNRRRNYQSDFKCIFTKTPYINSSVRFTSSKLIWLNTNEFNTQNENKFDCLYSPYKETNQLNSEAAFQTVYMSIWWSKSQSNVGLNNWNQVKLKYDSIDMFQDESKLLEENFIEINVVNCRVKAASCGQCMDKQLIDLGCGWCRTDSKCSMRKDCSSLNWINDLNNTDGNSYCSDPFITELRPACGPKQNAGTEIILTGQNLGLTSSDINVKMKSMTTNLDQECEIIKDSYVKASKIVCRTKPVYGSSSAINEYNVYVETNTKNPNSLYTTYNISTPLIFKYINPQIYSIEPSRGIKSGGTLIKISGKHLYCGSTLTFSMSGGLCEIISIKQSGNHHHHQTDSLDQVFCRTPAFNSNNSNNNNVFIQMRMDDYVVVLDKFKFEFVNDPKLVSFQPDRTIESGGLTMTIEGRDFEHIQTASLYLTPNLIQHRISSNQFIEIDEIKNSMLKSNCKILNATNIECVIPAIKKEKYLFTPSSSSIITDYSVHIQFNEQTRLFSQLDYSIQVYPDPEFKENQVFSDKAHIVFIEGENLLRGVKETDYKVWIGENTQCNITSITPNFIACIPPNESDLIINSSIMITKSSRRLFKREEITIRKLKPSNSVYDVRIQIGKNYVRTIGMLRYDANSDQLKYSDSIQLKYIIGGACLISLILFLTMISCFVTLKRRQNKQIRQLKRMQTEFENLEMRVARECKEAFTELQMDIGELANTLNQTGAPFHDFQTYCMKILLPNSNETERYYMTSSIDLRLTTANKENVKNGILMFSQLILNKKFLITFIHTLEADTHSFLLQDRVNLASYISICLHDRMDYFTDVLMTLLGELIEKLIDTKNNPKILLRRNESVAEKMLTNWFAFLLYDFIHNCAGTPLYILFLSIKQQIYKGPVDAITCEARYSLSEDKLIRQSIDYETITIRVQLHDFDETTHELIVKVLNCDTITQVKEKVLDAFFKGYPFSKRPHADELDFVYIPSEYGKNGHGRLILYDEDKTCKMDSDDHKRLNTLAHYKIPSGSLFILKPSAPDQSNSYGLIDSTNKNVENMTLLSKSSKGSSSPPTYSKLSTVGLHDFNNANNNNNYSTNNGLNTESNSSRLNTHLNTMKQNHHQQNKLVKKYHLIKTNDSVYSTTPNLKEDESKQEIAAKLVSEVYLTRLLATKGGMQSYVDDFFETVFSTAHGSSVLPCAIKYLFDFLDEQANLHGITDPDVVYTWKSNSLPLRFWVNIIKNPDFVFDIHKSNIVDASLSVIASTFMDSCSQSRLDLNKESPSGKLLFYKEVHKYRKWVESYYADIKHMSKIDDQDMNEMLNEESKKRPGVFNKNNALYRLYNDYVKRFRVKIEAALNNEFQEPAVVNINKHLNYRLQQVIYLMEAIEV